LGAREISYSATVAVGELVSVFANSASGGLVELALSASFGHSLTGSNGPSSVRSVPTSDLDCVHVSERTRREMGIGGNMTVLPAA
jgi:hypothetical protein